MGALAAVVLVASSVTAQEDGSAFPQVGSGEWEGLVELTGFLTVDHVADDGSFTTKITDVIGEPEIRVALSVDDEGRVSGTMAVDLSWFSESAGTAPSTLDPFHVRDDTHQTGTLALSGTAARLVAEGTLTQETNTVASGSLVEEVSGTTEREVAWVFSAVEASCRLVVARLVEASGISLMGSALLPRDSEGSGSTYHSELVARLLVWPKGQIPASISLAVDDVLDRFDALRMVESPEASDLLDLVAAWERLHAALAVLDECEAPAEGSLPVASRSFLVKALQSALDTALEGPDHYDAADLVDLWSVVYDEGALDGDRFLALHDAIAGKLDDAIEAGDIGTITDVLVFATVYRFPVLHEKASAALSGGT